jgi:hypothetical protein
MKAMLELQKKEQLRFEAEERIRQQKVEDEKKQLEEELTRLSQRSRTPSTGSTNTDKSGKQVM